MTQAILTVPVNLDASGTGCQQIYGPAASIVDATLTGFGPLGTVTIQPIQGSVERACVRVNGGQANQTASVLITQTLPSR